MKNFFFSFILILSILSSERARCQFSRNNAGLAKFIGTWQYSSNGKSFNVIIKKGFLEFNNESAEILQGTISYNNNGDVTKSPISGKTRFTLTNGRYAFNNNYNTVVFNYSDIRKNKSGEVLMTLEDNENASWTLRNTEGMRIGKFDREFSVPLKLILKKIE